MNRCSEAFDPTSCFSSADGVRPGAMDMQMFEFQFFLYKSPNNGILRSFYDTFDRWTLVFCRWICSCLCLPFTSLSCCRWQTCFCWTQAENSVHTATLLRLVYFAMIGSAKTLFVLLQVTVGWGWPSVLPRMKGSSYQGHKYKSQDVMCSILFIYVVKDNK